MSRAWPDVLPRQRWFRGKGRAIREMRLVDAGPLGPDAHAAWLVLAEVVFADGPPATYAVPVAFGEAATGAPIGALDEGGTTVPVRDALADPGACRALLDLFARAAEVELAAGRLRFTRTGAFPEAGLAFPPGAARPLAREQSNTSVVYGEALVLKVFRQVEPGVNPDAEVTGFLTTRTGFAHIPLLAGALEYVGPDGVGATVAVLQRFVASRGDGWAAALAHLGRLLDRVADRSPPSPGAAAPVVRAIGDGFLDSLGRLGELTGGLHAALASVPGDPAFAPEPIEPADARAWQGALSDLAQRALGALRARLPALPDALHPAAAAVLARSADLAGAGATLAALSGAGGAKIRVHGDYHLGQTLRTATGYVLFDFEGEPARPLASRRAKHCPLKDVAGMLRSFDYAVAAAVRGRGATDPARGAAALAWGRAWERLASETFLAGYRAAVDHAAVRLLPASAAATAKVLGAYTLEKALYELDYELDNRPDWVEIPLAGLRRLLGGAPPGARDSGSGDG